PLNGLVLQYGGQTRGKRGRVAFRFFIEPKLERLQVARVLQILLFPKKHGIGLGEPAFRFTDFSFECGVVDRAFVDIEQRHVIERDLMKKDDELHQIRVGLLPERFLATPEEVIQQRGDVVGQGVGVEVVVQGVVATRVARKRSIPSPTRRCTVSTEPRASTMTKRPGSCRAISRYPARTRSWNARSSCSKRVSRVAAVVSRPRARSRETRASVSKRNVRS